MADVDNNNGIMEVTSHEGLVGNENADAAIDVNIGEHAEEGVSEQDILQQALVEASESFPDGVQIQYTDSGEMEEGGMMNPADEGVEFTISSDGDGLVGNGQLTETFENGSFQVLASVSNEDANDNFVAESLSNGHQEEPQVQVMPENGLEYVNINEQGEEVQNDQLLEAQPDQNSATVSQQTIQLIQSGLAPPLGSSQNPIRIIQQGNQYTPVQQLTPEQLQQIMQVVQQQQVTQTVESGSSVLFNPQTNTRIVYRVIYPSDLHKDGSGDGTKAKGQQTLLQSTPKKGYRKRLREDEQERIEGPELSKEEKEMKKKMRAKTRSGRISKPPKHMVKDFKHIHVLDYEEDYDDSDGGYSDYKVEDEEEEDDDKSKKDDDDAYIAPGLNSMKPKNWKCITCEKAYIGKAGLGRHLKLYPTHGYLDPDGDGDMEPPPPGTSDETTPTTPATPNGISSTANSTASLSEDSRDSSYSLPYNPTPTTTRPRGTGLRGRPRGSRSGGWRGRGAYSKVDPETRRRAKLKEITRECTDEDLMEIVLPRLAKVITLWEFLLMKVEKGDPAWPHADDIYTEYEKLHHHVKKLCQEYLQFVPESTETLKESSSLLQVENTVVADALGLKVGRHKVKEIPDSDADITYKYKFLTTNHNVDIDYTNKSFLKRTVEVVSPDQIISSNKKPRTITIKPNVTILPTVTTAKNDVCAVSKWNSAGGATTSVLMTNSVPQTPILVQTSESKVQNVGHVSSSANTGIDQTLYSGRTSSSKAVSLLTNSITKHMPSSQSKLQSQSQKFIIVSGNNISEGMNIPTSSATNPSDSRSAAVRASFPPKLALSATPQTSSYMETSHLISNNQNVISSDRVIYQNSVTGAYSLGTLPVPQSAGNIPATSSQPVVIAIPQSNHPQLLQNVIVNDLGMLKSEHSDMGAVMQVNSKVNSIASVGEVLNTGHVLKSLNAVTNLMQNVSSNPKPNPNVTESQRSDLNSQNAVYSFHNGDSAQSGNTFYTVNSDMMLVSSQDAGLSEDHMTADEANGIATEYSQVVMSNNVDGEVVGVINSIDPSDTSTQVKLEPTTHVNSDVTHVNSDVTHMNSDVNTDSQQQFVEQDQSEMAAMEMTDGQADDAKQQFFQYEAVMDNSDQVETIQVPATNIFQTEDGVIIIQNPDGTTVQLQGSDGQPISMETVQALLAMDGETQFFAEQPDAMEEQ